MSRLRRLPLAALIAAATLGGCVYRFDQWSGPAQPPPPPAPPAAVQFVAFGDAGSGSEGQAAVGRAMARVCADRGCDFALELGDNFYPRGVGSVDDPQFDTAFEKPYELLNVPVYAVLGNHDNGGAHGGDGGNNARGDFQVLHHATKWRMPARYYYIRMPVDSDPPLAAFFGLDSSPLTAWAADADPRWAPQAYAAQQLDWLRSVMASSTATWKVVFAHHPYVSNGPHGDAGHYEARAGDAATASGALWQNLIEQGVCAQHVDLYLAAHDHTLQWLKPLARCGRTQFIVSGAGATDELDPLADEHRHPAYWQSAGRGGFFWIRLDAERMTVAAFTLNDQNELTANPYRHPVPAYEESVMRLR